MSSTPDIDTFIKGCQFQTVTAPTPLAYHPATPLLQSLASLGFPAAFGKPWSLDTIRAAIRKGPHTSTRKPSSTAFYHAELEDHVYRGFSLLLTVETAVLLFGRRLRISRQDSVPQTNREDQLIYDYTPSPPVGDLLLPLSIQDTPTVIVSIDRKVAPPSMQFGPCLPHLLQQIWEADPQDSPVYLSKWNITDAFHHCVIRSANVGAFSYVVPPLP